MKARHFLFLLVLYAMVINVKPHKQNCRTRMVRDGIFMPTPRSMLSLEVFKHKVAGLTWTSFYFGSTFPDEAIFLYGKFRFSFPDDYATLKTEYSGILSNGTCVNETTYVYDGTHPQTARSNRAAFLGKSYRTFFSSDVDSYLLSIECLQNKPVRRCPIEDTLTFFFVKSPRPDSLPLHRALTDLWRVTCLTLDDSPGQFRQVFVYGTNDC